MLPRAISVFLQENRPSVLRVYASALIAEILRKARQLLLLCWKCSRRSMQEFRQLQFIGHSNRKMGLTIFSLLPIRVLLHGL